MKTYLWRKTFTAIQTAEEKTIRGKLAFKTIVKHWLETKDPVIVLLSIDSAFHEGFEGDLKMNALMTTIKNHIQGKITILISDKAHLQTMSLDYQNNSEIAFEECLLRAQKLETRYQPYFKSCKVVYWHSYICQEECFATFLHKMKELFQVDPVFRELLHRDAEETYTEKRRAKFSDKGQFIEKATEDILEQCACLLVIAHKGYRFQFYPGSPFASTEYINRIWLPKEKQVSWIDVFLSIEKKTIMNHM